MITIIIIWNRLLNLSPCCLSLSADGLWKSLNPLSTICLKPLKLCQSWTGFFELFELFEQHYLSETTLTLSILNRIFWDIWIIWTVLFVWNHCNFLNRIFWNVWIIWTALFVWNHFYLSFLNNFFVEIFELFE